MLILNGPPDTILTHAFKATGHPVKMRNTISMSSRAMELKGCDPNNLNGIRIYLGTFYNEYVKLRASLIPADKEIEYKHLLFLMQGYCGFLRSDSAICDYWVVIDYDKHSLDNRTLKL